jgi:hypothetical protein
MEWFWVIFHSLLSWSLSAHRTFKLWFVVASHSFMIIAFEAYNLCNLLLVNTIVPFHEPWSFYFLLIFKLFPIGYGPTPSKRKEIVLEQEVVKGLSLYYIGKKERILFETRFLVCKVSGSSFPRGGIQRACNFSKWVGGVEETSSKCCKFLSVEECSLSL